MTTMVLWMTVLLIYGVSTGTAMMPSKPGPSHNKPGPSNNQPGPSNNKPGPSNNQPGPSNNDEYPLDMAPDSVDDMYSDCKVEMKKEMSKYLENEKNTDQQFKDAWAEAERDSKWKSPSLVEREQALALYVYTSSFYRNFNNAVRTEGPQYKTTFKYHALHFLLTDAIQSLNAAKKCLTVYRKLGVPFRQNVVNTQVRFGAFASASMGNYLKINFFGKKSCFEIITCMGAEISVFSKYQNQREVLIPPYEVFKVTEVLHSSEKQPLPCDVVYKLKSTGQAVSKLNCALFPK